MAPQGAWIEKDNRHGQKKIPGIDTFSATYIYQVVINIPYLLTNLDFFSPIKPPSKPAVSCLHNQSTPATKILGTQDCPGPVSSSECVA